jgi:hypothetical protein
MAARMLVRSAETEAGDPANPENGAALSVDPGWFKLIG